MLDPTGWDLVIPSRTTPAPYLAHALVAQVTHMPIRHVFIVGATPEWTASLEWVTAIPTKQSPNHAAAWHNIATALRVTLDDDRIGEQFVWSADDVFTLSDHTPGVYARMNSLDWYVARITTGGRGNASYHAAYVRGVVAQRDLLRREGHDTATYPNLCCHMPLTLTKTGLEADMARLSAVPGHPLGAFKAAHTPMSEPIRVVDPKLRGTEQQLPDREVVSLMANTWTRRRQIARQLARRFPDPVV